MRYFARRLLSVIPTLLLIVVATFILIRLVPGDPVDTLLGEYATAEAEAVLRAKLGLDQSLPVQLWRYMATLAAGDLGVSLRTGRPVLYELVVAFPPTFLLALAGSALAVLAAIPLGVYSALRRGTPADLLTMLLAVIGRSAPVFWLGLLLILLFSVRLGWLPVIGVGDWADPASVLSALVLPATALAVSEAAFLARATRSSMLDVLAEDYVRTARAKGLSERIVVYKHALRNATIPVITILGLSFGRLISGSVVVEKAFSRTGLGTLFVTSIDNRDYPLVQGCVLFFAVLFVTVNLLVDLTYSIVDPRIRYD